MSDLVYRQASRDEVQTAVEWAAAEGWNPGIDDADIFRATDPEGFVVLEQAGEVVGSGSIVSYGDFGFMGFFMVREGLRRQGLGAPFWEWRRDTLLKRLRPGSAIGMDGVFDMQPFYARGGFRFSHRNLRMEGRGLPLPGASRTVSLDQVAFAQVEALDRRCFGCCRPAFLRRWIQPAHGRALGIVEDGGLRGFGVVRQCRVGWKIGPLFAETPALAGELFEGLASVEAGAPIFLDIPENNPEAVALAKRHQMREVFGCARMYWGEPPELPWGQIYGITTFELG